MSVNWFDKEAGRACGEETVLKGRVGSPVPHSHCSFPFFQPRNLASGCSEFSLCHMLLCLSLEVIIDDTLTQPGCISTPPSLPLNTTSHATV